MRGEVRNSRCRMLWLLLEMHLYITSRRNYAEYLCTSNVVSQTFINARDMHYANFPIPSHSTRRSVLHPSSLNA